MHCSCWVSLGLRKGIRYSFSTNNFSRRLLQWRMTLIHKNEPLPLSVLYLIAWILRHILVVGLMLSSIKGDITSTLSHWELLRKVVALVDDSVPEKWTPIRSLLHRLAWNRRPIFFLFLVWNSKTEGSRVFTLNTFSGSCCSGGWLWSRKVFSCLFEFVYIYM